MAKYCTRCGQYSDDTAYVCAACGAPFRATYEDDEQVTVVADEAYPSRDSVPAPEYQQPVYQQPTYQQPEYQQPEYPQPMQQPAYQQPAQAYPQNTYQPQRNVATPLNMSSPRVAVPLQQQATTEKKNKGMGLGIGIAVGIVVLIAAIVVLIIVLVNNGNSNSNSGSGSGGGQSISQSSLQGNYVLNAQTDHGTRFTRDELLQYLGGDITLTINSDNTGTLVAYDGSSTPMVFNPSDHSVSMAGTPASYTVSGNTLTVTITDDSGSVVNEFVKQ